MAALGSMTAVAGGLLLGFAVTDSGPYGEVMLDERGSAVALGSCLAFFYLLVPAGTAAAVHGFDGDGALCWVSKPINSKQLLTVLKNLLP